VGRTSDARQRLIEAAADLFGHRAYSAIGVAEICARAGVNKGSFYYFFESKEALALAVVDRHWAGQEAQWRSILTKAEPFTERLRQLFLATAEVQENALTDTGAVTGCLFGSLAVQVSAENAMVRERLRAIFEEQVRLIETTVQEAVDRGELSIDDPAAAARSIVAQLEGLIMFVKLYNDPAQLESLWRDSLLLLGATHSPVN
jgi:TetR/AcrR family transcriptional regulator, transcriptional repressor for nem operon